MEDRKLFATAAKRAQKMLPPILGDLIRSRIMYGMDDNLRREFALAVMSLPHPNVLKAASLLGQYVTITYTETGNSASGWLTRLKHESVDGVEQIWAVFDWSWMGDLLYPGVTIEQEDPEHEH